MSWNVTNVNTFSNILYLKIIYFKNKKYLTKIEPVLIEIKGDSTLHYLRTY